MFVLLYELPIPHIIPDPYSIVRCFVYFSFFCKNFNNTAISITLPRKQMKYCAIIKFVDITFFRVSLKSFWWASICGF